MLSYSQMTVVIGVPCNEVPHLVDGTHEPHEIYGRVCFAWDADRIERVKVEFRRDVGLEPSVYPFEADRQEQ